jgi:hypothetical protein
MFSSPFVSAEDDFSFSFDLLDETNLITSSTTVALVNGSNFIE